jgi:hypothetical protein
MGEVEIGAGAGAGETAAGEVGLEGTTADDGAGELAGAEATGAAAGADAVTAGTDDAGAGEAAAGVAGFGAFAVATGGLGAAVGGAGTCAAATETKTSARGISQTLARRGHGSLVDRFEPLIRGRRARNSGSPAASCADFIASIFAERSDGRRFRTRRVRSAADASSPARDDSCSIATFVGVRKKGDVWRGALRSSSASESRI